MIDTKPTSRLHTQSRDSILEQSVLAILSGVGLFLTGFLVIILIYQLIFLGKVFPGVNVAGVDLSGIRRTEAANYLNQNITYANTGSIVIQEDENSWSYTPQEIGLIFNSDATAENAYKVGRTGLPWTRLITQFDIIWDNITLAPPIHL